MERCGARDALRASEHLRRQPYRQGSHRACRILMGRHSWTVDIQSAYLEALAAEPGFTAVAKAATLTRALGRRRRWPQRKDGVAANQGSHDLRQLERTISGRPKRTSRTLNRTSEEWQHWTSGPM